ncbi:MULTISPECIES: DUF3987 domain-containing protein [unclassified Flavobacterium]|uniref:DUF3987 domain-containing protein n=1 Tax=unclassified Flavobacterium TaxID=196869 RepID=UPI00131E0891|nr:MULTISPECIES: DUF3987 domain-containing protein [unclassified Flavobacterium]
MERRLISKEIYKNLPEELKSITESFEGREKDIVLMSSIGVLSNCLPNIKGYYDGDDVYSNLYVLIVAPPASGKGVMNYSRILIDKIHNKILEDSKAELILCENSKKGNKESKNEVCPNIKIKILPANVSTAEVYSFLGSSEHGLLIMESEADTLSSMLNNDWSNYSDVLRKAWHHEPLSISRKMDSVFEEISEPKLSMVISGTQNQLQPLIKSKDNGLFSRFIVYSFDEIAEFKNVFAVKSKENRIAFENLSNDIFNLYGELSNLKKPIEFQFTENQIKRFTSRFKYIRAFIIDKHSEAFLSNLNRHGLIMFRISMILTALRFKSKLAETETLVCTNRDFLIALELTDTLLRHSQFTFDTIESGVLSIQDEEILDELRDQFTRQDVLEVGIKRNIPKRTIDDKLSQFQKKRFIKKVKKGVFKKL